MFLYILRRFTLNSSTCCLDVGLPLAVQQDALLVVTASPLECVCMRAAHLPIGIRLSTDANATRLLEWLQWAHT